MSAGTLGDVLTRKRMQLPQFEYMWAARLPEINLKEVEDYTGAAKKNVAEKVWDWIRSTPDLSVDVSHRVVAIDSPYGSFDTNEHQFGTTMHSTPGVFKPGSANIRLQEYEDGKTLAYLVNWQSMIRNPDQTYNPPAVYKKNIRIIRKSNAGADLHVTVLKGCHPAEITPTSWNYESGGVLLYSVNFAIDGIEHELMDISDVRKAVKAADAGILQTIDPGIMNWLRSVI